MHLSHNQKVGGSSPLAGTITARLWVRFPSQQPVKMKNTIDYRQSERTAKIAAYEFELDFDTQIIRRMCQASGKPVPPEKWWTKEYVETMALCPRDEGVLPVWESVEVIGR